LKTEKEKKDIERGEKTGKVLKWDDGSLAENSKKELT